jgi:hypothetical protein
MKKLILALIGIVLALGSLFFAYYTVRLAYVNFFVEETAAHRSGGMLIGAVIFPLATIVFGIISWLCFKKIRSAK